MAWGKSPQRPRLASELSPMLCDLGQVTSPPEPPCAKHRVCRLSGLQRCWKVGPPYDNHSATVQCSRGPLSVTLEVVNSSSSLSLSRATWKTSEEQEKCPSLISNVSA